MTTTTPSAALVPVAPVFTNTERLALAGFLAGYSWCHQHHLRLFQARRPDIECFARDLETRGRARATITRRLCTIAGFYRYAVEEDLLEHSPAAPVRRLRLDYESHATGLDRNELGALLVAAGLGPPAEHALVSLLALNGLRVSEATGANIENLGVERGHRTLVITRKGGKVVTIPLAPRTDAIGPKMARLRREHHRLPGNGYCTRPPQLDCAFESICETCSYFQTSIEFRPALAAQRDHAATHGHSGRQELSARLLSQVDNTQAS